MKITDSQKYITRIFTVEDEEETYTVTYKEDLTQDSWEIENAEGDTFGTTTGIGVNLILICEDEMYGNPVKG